MKNGCKVEAGTVTASVKNIEGMIYFLTLFVIQTTEGRKNLGNTMVGVNVDVLEILRFALNDTLC